MVNCKKWEYQRQFIVGLRIGKGWSELEDSESESRERNRSETRSKKKKEQLQSRRMKRVGEDNLNRKV